MRNQNSKIEGFDNPELETLDPELIYEMDSQELLDELLKSRVSAMQDEGSHVEALLDMAVRCEQEGPDAKAEALIEWVFRLRTGRP